MEVAFVNVDGAPAIVDEKPAGEINADASGPTEVERAGMRVVYKLDASVVTCPTVQSATAGAQLITVYTVVV